MSNEIDIHLLRTYDLSDYKKITKVTNWPFVMDEKSPLISSQSLLPWLIKAFAGATDSQKLAAVILHCVTVKLSCPQTSFLRLQF